MKRFFNLSIIALSVMALSTIFLSSCSKDDEKKDVPEPPVATGTEIKIEFQDKGSIQNIADIHVKYTNENGQEVDEAVTKGQFKKTINITKYPFQFNATAYYIPLAGATIDPEALYSVDVSYDYSVTTTYTSDSPSMKMGGSSYNYSFKGDKVEKFFEDRTINILSINIGENGKLSE